MRSGLRHWAERIKSFLAQTCCCVWPGFGNQRLNGCWVTYVSIRSNGVRKQELTSVLNAGLGKVQEKIRLFCSNRVASFRRSLLVDVLGETSLLDQSLHHVKEGCIEVVLIIKRMASVCTVGLFQKYNQIKFVCPFCCIFHRIS